MTQQSSLVAKFARCMPRPDFAPPRQMSQHFRTAIKAEINCYTWALACPGIGWGVPGSINNEDYVRFNVINRPVLGKLLLQDGLVEIDSRDAFDPANHAIALRYGETDFHFYVRCADGTWSHKIGKLTPINFDRECNAITDPEKLFDPRYPRFGGYYAIPATGIEYFVRCPDIADYDLAEPSLASHCTM